MSRLTELKYDITKLDAKIKNMQERIEKMAFDCKEEVGIEFLASTVSYFKELREYMQLEEQGLMLRLPCGIGADVYFIPSETNYKLNILQGYPESNRVYNQTVERITFTPNGWYLECDKDLEYAKDHILIDKLYKETWFLSQTEAEQKLKEMESNHE